MNLTFINERNRFGHMCIHLANNRLIVGGGDRLRKQFPIARSLLIDHILPLKNCNFGYGLLIGSGDF